MTYEPIRPRQMPNIRTLLSPALLAYGISGTAAVASFVATILLSRGGGAALVGEYALAASTANMLATFAVLGLDRIVMREVAGDLREGLGSAARAKVTGMARIVLLVSLAVAALYLPLVLFGPLSALLDADQGAMLAVVIGILVWPLYRIACHGLRGAGMPIAAQFFEALPTWLFTAVILLLVFAQSITSAGQVTAIFLGLQLVALLGGGLLLWRRARTWGAPASIAMPDYLRAGLPIMAIAFLQTFSEWLLLAQISAKASSVEVGAFRVAFQVLTVTTLVLATGESYVAPKLAGDFRAGNIDRMWQRHRRATVLMLLLAAPLLLVAMVAPEWLMVTAFGPEFAVAAVPLAIMALGQFFNVLRGPLGAMLLMTGNEGVLLKITIGGLALLLVLSFVLIPRFGLVGAAIAYSAAIILRSVVGYVVARRLLVSATAVPPLQP